MQQNIAGKDVICENNDNICDWSKPTSTATPGRCPAEVPGAGSRCPQPPQPGPCAPTCPSNCIDRRCPAGTPPPAAAKAAEAAEAGPAAPASPAPWPWTGGSAGCGPGFKGGGRKRGWAGGPGGRHRPLPPSLSPFLPSPALGTESPGPGDSRDTPPSPFPLRSAVPIARSRQPPFVSEIFRSD